MGLEFSSTRFCTGLNYLTFLTNGADIKALHAAILLRCRECKGGETSLPLAFARATRGLAFAGAQNALFENEISVQAALGRLHHGEAAAHAVIEGETLQRDDAELSLAILFD